MSGMQRLALVAAAAIVLIAGFIILRPSDDDSKSTAETATQTVAVTPTTTTPDVTTVASTPTSAPKPKPKPKPKGPLLTADKVTEIEVEKGETVRFRALSKDGDEIHVHGFDISKDAPAGKTVSMAFKADLEGIFEVEFEQSGTEIARLKVTP